MSEKTESLALAKKRRNNDTEEALMVLRGEIDAAINASKCLETHYDAKRGDVPGELYRKGIAACDLLEPQVERFASAVKQFRAVCSEVRAELSEG